MNIPRGSRMQHMQHRYRTNAQCTVYSAHNDADDDKRYLRHAIVTHHVITGSGTKPEIPHGGVKPTFLSYALY